MQKTTLILLSSLFLYSCNAGPPAPAVVENSTPTVGGTATEAANASAPTATDSPQTGRLQRIVEDILERTNAERVNRNLPALNLNTQLALAAQTHADDMARNKFLSHTGSDDSKLRDRIERVGYDWSAIAENVAYNQASAEAVVTSWMESPGHRENILKTEVAEIGIGYATTANGEPYYVQVFGKSFE